MSTGIATNLQREVSKTSAEKESTGENVVNQFPELQDASQDAVHAAIRPKIDYSSLGAFFWSLGR